MIIPDNGGNNVILIGKLTIGIRILIERRQLNDKESGYWMATTLEEAMNHMSHRFELRSSLC